MRIGIDATCWSNRRGYGRFTRGLIRSLLKIETSHEWILFVDAQTYAQGQMPQEATCVVVPTTASPAEAASASGRRSLRDLWTMTQSVARYPLDVLFFPSVYTYFPALTRAKIILGVHDAIAEDYPELIFPALRSRRLWAFKGWLAHHQADYILTVSEYAKGRILHHFRHASEQVWVINEAPDPIFHHLTPEQIDWEMLRRYGLSPSDRFLVYLGGINPHKNLEMLIHSLAVFCQESEDEPVKLVIVGDITTDVFTPGLERLNTQIAKLQMETRVKFTGYVPDTEVVHLLNVAQAVVLPSMAEGFGLPAIEGAACGIPVIATRNSPLPDLLAGGGIFIDPTQPEQLTDALRQILREQQKQQHLGKVALERARKFSWERSATQMQQMLAILEQKNQRHR